MTQIFLVLVTLLLLIASVNEFRSMRIPATRYKWKRKLLTLNCGLKDIEQFLHTDIPIDSHRDSNPRANYADHDHANTVHTYLHALCATFLDECSQYNFVWTALLEAKYGCKDKKLAHIRTKLSRSSTKFALAL